MVYYQHFENQENLIFIPILDGKRAILHYSFYLVFGCT